MPVASGRGNRVRYGSAWTGAVIIVAVAVGSTPTASGADRPSCERVEGRTVAANEQVRIVRQTAARRGHPTFACHRANGRVTALGGVDRGTSRSDVTAIRLVGRRVAYRTEVADQYGRDSFFVTIVDTRTGRRTGFAVGAPPGALGEVSGVPSIALTRDGTLAWIVATTRGEYAVHVVRAARDEVVDSGADIEPASLAAGRSVVYWTRGGIARSIETRSGR